jgi:hypothetical protein
MSAGFMMTLPTCKNAALFCFQMPGIRRTFAKEAAHVDISTCKDQYAANLFLLTNIPRVA